MSVPETKVTFEDIRSKLRRKRIVAVRHRFMRWLHHKGLSTPKIGKLLNRDHSTVVYALKKEMKGYGKQTGQAVQSDWSDISDLLRP